MISLVNLSPEEAVEVLAKRAADLRTRPVSYTEKRAYGISDLLTSIGSNPTVRNSLIGAGAGAGVGGLSTLLGNTNKEDEERKSILGSMLTGGLAGAAVGGGGTLAYNKWNEAGKGQGLGDAMKPGMIKDPTTGKTFKIDPEALRRDPDLISKLNDAQAGPSWPQRTFSYGLGVPWNFIRRGPLGAFGLTPKADSLDLNDQLPISSWALPTAATVDLATHLPGLNTGSRYGFGRVTPEKTLDPKTLMEGMRGKDNINDIHDVIKHEISTNQPGPRGINAAEETVRNMNKSNRPWWDSKADWYKKLNAPVKRLFGKGHKPGDIVYETNEPWTAVAGANPQPVAPTAPNSQAMAQQALTGDVRRINRSVAELANTRGWAAREKLQDPKGTPRSLFRMFGKDRPMMGRVGGTAARIAGYGLLPMLEYAMWNAADRSGKDKDIKELMRQNVKEVK